MPKELPSDLADRLADTIARHPEGISPKALFESYSKEASHRSLARIVKGLAQRGRIVVVGGGRTTTYKPAPPKGGRVLLTEAGDRLPAESRDTVAPAEIYVPLTGESKLLRDRVRRPLTQRQPIGYDRALLDVYEPNKTFYLADANWRDRLRDIGRTPTHAQAHVAGTYARDILNRLLIDLSWASSHLEGNTYTRLDTQQLIEHGKVAEGKDRLETQMILNHKQAIEFLIEGAAEISFNMHTLTNLHALLSENLLGDPADEGRLRSRIVDIGGTVYRPLQVPQQIEELFRLFLEKAAAIADPFEQAFFAMVHIPYLQPFVDVNKRVSRLAANIPFIKANLCPLSFVDVPERAYVEGTLVIYEHARIDLLRDVFMWAYERSCQNFKAIAGALPEPDPLRLKYRAELREGVARLVRETRATRIEDARRIAGNLIPPEDRDKFVSMMMRELNILHEGNIARYGLRLTDFRTWKDSIAKA
jgi:hypothetical protein